MDILYPVRPTGRDLARRRSSIPETKGARDGGEQGESTERDLATNDPEGDVTRGDLHELNNP
jgi:hypothetical protein